MYKLLLTIMALYSFLVVYGCSPADPDTALEPYSRSVEEVIEQFTTAYNTQDMEEYADCFSDDFVFKVHFSEYWGPLPHYPDSVWYLPTELLYTEALFASPESISLEIKVLSLESSQSIENGVEAECEFDLKVFLDPTSGYWATGKVEFIFEEISANVWSIREWEDFSDTKTRERCVWSRVKWIFYEKTL